MDPRRLPLFALVAIALIGTACGNEHELLTFGGHASEDAPHGDPPWPQLHENDEDEPDGGNDRDPGGNEDEEGTTDDERDDDDGCTLTQGYWKNHEEAWPVDSLVLGGVSYGAPELDGLLHMSVGGDSSLILGHQLIAALLNVAAGAGTPPDVDVALGSAQQWMASHADRDGRLPYGTPSGSAEHSEASELADALAAFNEGSTGPGHCR